MALWISSAALFLLAHFLSSPGGPAADTVSGTITPTWILDLRPAVGSEPLGLVVGRGHETRLQPKTSLWFVDNNTVVATFVTHEEKVALSSRDSDVNLPLRLRAIFLDASSGKVTSIQAWPSDSRFAGIVAVNDGSFITQRGNVLGLYSSDAKEVRRLTLPLVEQDHWGWYPHTSPTGKNILFATPDPRTTSPTTWIWVDASTLKVVRSWREVQSGEVAISDDTMAMIACGFYPYRCNPSLEIKRRATDWKSILAIEGEHYHWLPVFLNEGTIFLSNRPWKLLQSDGKIILTESAPFEGGTAVTSANGQRFLLPSFQWKGGVADLDIGAHGELKAISVYDAPFQERSYILDVKGSKVRETAHLALSPDGSKLAILYEETVYLFQLPPAPSAQHTDSMNLKNGNLHVRVPVPATAKPKPQVP